MLCRRSQHPCFPWKTAQAPGHALKIPNTRKLRSHQEECKRTEVNFTLSREALGGWDHKELSHIFDIGEIIQRRSGPGQ